jgi:hypothetical protein
MSARARSTMCEFRITGAKFCRPSFIRSTPDIPEVTLKLLNRRQRRQQAIFHRIETEMTSALRAEVDPFWLKPGP